MKSSSKRLFASLALIAVLAICCYVGCLSLGIFHDPFDEEPFTVEAWASTDQPDRGRMAWDAIRQLPPGTTADRVRELLGNGGWVPGGEDGRVDGFGNRLEHPETWAYYLGCWSGIGPYGFDSAYLYVHFDADGRVVAAVITGG